MTDGVTIDTDALKRLSRDLAAMTRTIEDVKTPSKKAGQILKAEAVDLAPRESGALEKGISFRVAVTKKGKATIRLASGKVPYAVRQHWVQQKGRRGDMYVWKALENKADDVRQQFVDQVNKASKGLTSNG